MREIKFRAWDEERKRFMPTHIMINNLCSDDEDRLICGTYRENGDWYQPVLLQYTGLEYLREELYEGDILRLDNGKNYEVKYIHGGFWCGDFPLYKLVYQNRITKIGDIYENPELLETSCN